MDKVEPRRSYGASAFLFIQARISTILDSVSDKHINRRVDRQTDR